MQDRKRPRIKMVNKYVWADRNNMGGLIVSFFYTIVEDQFRRWIKDGLLPEMVFHNHEFTDLDYFILDSFGYTPEDRSTDSVQRKVNDFTHEMTGKLDWLFTEHGFSLFRAYQARMKTGVDGPVIGGGNEEYP